MAACPHVRHICPWSFWLKPFLVQDLSTNSTCYSDFPDLSSLRSYLLVRC